MAAMDNSQFWLAEFFKNLLLWNHLAKLNQTIQEASMRGPLLNFLFHPDWNTNMAVMGISCFWLADIKNSSTLKPLGQMEPYLTVSIYGKAFTMYPHFILIGQQLWPPWEKCLKNLLRDSLDNLEQYLVKFQSIHVSDDSNLHPRWPSSVDNSSCRHFLMGLLKSGERYRLTWASSLFKEIKTVCNI